MPERRTFTEEQEKQIVEHYQSGDFAVNELARMFKCGPVPISRVLRDHEVPIRNAASPAKTTRNDKILDLHEQGKSLAEIAEVFNITRNRVHQIVARGY